MYSISKLSKLAGISTRTLRYYDEIGLLKPSYTNKSEIRFYDDHAVELLQQILFYRERGFELKRIKKILYDKDFDVKKALEDHLVQLTKQQQKLELLIHTVQQTILELRGEQTMSIEEKFEAFKKQLVTDNEQKYGTELQQNYSKHELANSKQKILNMTKNDWQQAQDTENKLLLELNLAVTAKISPQSKKAQEIVALHTTWLTLLSPTYSAKLHRELADLYTTDERFKEYYDRDVVGCADFLKQAILYWI